MEAHDHTTGRNAYSCAITGPISSGSYTSVYALGIAAMSAANDKEAIRALKYRAIAWKLMKISGGSDLTYTVRIGDTTAGVNAGAQVIAKNTNEEVSSAEFPVDGYGMQDIYVRSTGAAFDACLYWIAATGNVVHSSSDK